MAFGIYVHIPYCIQRCSYCDFATYEKSSILPPSEYIELVKKEIQVYGPLLIDQEVSTIYFGGGTPSLVEAELLTSLIKTLQETGFKFKPNLEITLEINPATLNEKKMATYLSSGINRFSVGAQTFRDDLLKRVGREHNAQDTRQTLEFLSQKGLNYTFDLLFALPGQTLEDLKRDLEWVQYFSPAHLSAYCLTVPDVHPLAKTRLPEQEQIEMFDLIEERLGQMGMERYEISNFAKPGFESQHNMIYWTDENFWGVGLSAHSYLKDDAWGKRFWNSRHIREYIRKMQEIPNIEASSVIEFREASEFEELLEHQALTDFCHIFLRIKRGLSLGELESKFNSLRRKQVEDIFFDMENKGLMEKKEDHWRLSQRGVLLSNKVFEACTFLK